MVKVSSALQSKRVRAKAKGPSLRKLLKAIEFVVFDFDGVFTDNRVFVFQNGEEAVVCSREDSMGLHLLREKGVDMLILSTETNPIVHKRAEKLKLKCVAPVSDKGAALKELLAEKGMAPQRTAYIGNDLNDVDCLRSVGLGAVVSDANPMAFPHANLVLKRPGGNGAVREFCEMVWAAKNG